MPHPILFPLPHFIVSTIESTSYDHSGEATLIMAPGRYSDSDSEPEIVAPPLQFNFEDKEPYQHLSKHLVTDGITKRKVNGGTSLATLYPYNNTKVNNVLLQNLTRVAAPKVPCQVLKSDGQWMAPSITQFGAANRFRITYNKLVSVSEARKLPLH